MAEVSDKQVAQILYMLGGMIEKESDLSAAFQNRYREAVARGYVELVTIGRVTPEGEKFMSQYYQKRDAGSIDG